MRNSLLMILAVMLTPLSAQNMADFNVVPLPREVVAKTDVSGIPLSSIECICYGKNGADMQRNAQFLSRYVEEATGERLPVQIDVSRSIPAILLEINPKIKETEGYVIDVQKKAVKIQGATPQGVFYGIQTLRKALPKAPASEVVIPAVRVSDAPRFSYRAMHLDVSRHFYGMDVVKEYIDRLALHNMNTFHFHLTDDQGWRIEVPQYSKLTEVGAWRDKTVIGRNTGLYEYNRHGGFFTRQQLKEIVDYAAERYITVIPEIELPGHTLAILAAYPELGCTGGPYEVCPDWGVFDDVLCAGNEEVFKLLEGVFDVVADIFPSEYIHIGGDESPRTRWKECVKCQQRIAQEGLKTDASGAAEDKLQGYFVKRVEKYLQSKGKKVIGWDEILDCDINPSATIMSWRGTEGGIRASEKGHDVIMVPTSPMYFDYYQTPESDWVKPFLIGGYEPLDRVYSFEPVPSTLSAEARNHIIGVQANLWTEYIVGKELLEYQIMPRMAALAEVQWMLPEKKDYQSFLQRERKMLGIYERYGWKYCDAAWK